MRIDVNSAPEWFSNIIYSDSFNKAYYASILVQHTHNNPIVIAFYCMLMRIALPLSSNDSLDEETKEKYRLTKVIRNRYHLWIFLSKNPSLVQFRVRNITNVPNESQQENEGTNQNMGRNSIIDIEENKGDADSDIDEESKEESKLPYYPSINMSESSYKDRYL